MQAERRRSSVVEQGTHKPLVSGPTPLVAINEMRGARLARSVSQQIVHIGERMASPTTRVVTPVSWAFAPEWLTIRQAAELSGHDRETLGWLIQDGAVDARRWGKTWLIEKVSLREFQDALALVLHWRG